MNYFEQMCSYSNLFSSRGQHTTVKAPEQTYVQRRVETVRPYGDGTFVENVVELRTEPVQPMKRCGLLVIDI